MKNSNRSNRVWKMVQDKGYYIVLFLCVLAVGISGYIFISTAVKQDETPQPTLSVPLTPEVLDTPTDGKPAASEQAEQVLTREEQDALLREQARGMAVPPLRGEILRDFSLEALSYNQTTRDWRLHAAVDIASEGGEVLACMAGTVTLVEEDDFLGTTVVISHDGGYETRYSNLAPETIVKAGDMVVPGQQLGFAGSSAIGESADPGHLHFQVLIYGEPVDPTEFLQ